MRQRSQQTHAGGHHEAINLRTLTTTALLLLGIALPSGVAVGQEKTLKEQLVGTWT